MRSVRELGEGVLLGHASWVWWGPIDGGGKGKDGESWGAAATHTR
jgi:hypothetical protein